MITTRTKIMIGAAGVALVLLIAWNYNQKNKRIARQRMPRVN